MGGQCELPHGLHFAPKTYLTSTILLVSRT
jgi:hypothetical protein